MPAILAHRVRSALPLFSLLLLAQRLLSSAPPLPLGTVVPDAHYSGLYDHFVLAWKPFSMTVPIKSFSNLSYSGAG